MLIVAAAALAPPVQATAKGMALLAEIFSIPTPLNLIPEPDRTEVHLTHGSADLYTGSNPRAPGVLLVHGVAPGGPRDERMQQVAIALAKMGRTVLAPSLAIADERLDPTDLVRITGAIDHLADLTGGKVVVIGFSFGAAFTLVALEEDPQIQSNVHQVATVGTYFDLVHLLQGVTTGLVEGPDGFEQWTPDSRATEIVTDFLGGYTNPGVAEIIRNAIQLQDATGLSDPARAVVELMINDDPGQTPALVQALPEPLPTAIARLSPATGIDKLLVPVLAMHSRQDPAAPPSESELLVEALPGSGQGSLTIVGSFRHVSPDQGAARLSDAAPLISFASRVIGAQQQW